jgi:hypothetical protein
MTPDNPLQSLANCSRFVAEMLNRPTVVRSTVVVWPASPYTGMSEGEVVSVCGCGKNWILPPASSRHTAMKCIEATNACIGMTTFRILRI